MLDLTKPFTVDDVRRLIASKDDSVHRQIRVTKKGMAFISDTVGSEDTGDLIFRLETFSAGNGYTGEAAAADTHWVSKIHEVLKSNWPKPMDSYIDSY